MNKGFENKKYDITLEIIDELYDVQDFSYDRNQYYIKYNQMKKQNIKIIEKKVEQDGRVQKVYENGKREILFSNGVKREVLSDGYTIVQFSNHDIK